MLPPRQVPRLALFLQVNHHWGRAIAQGVFRAARAATRWQPFLVMNSESLLNSIADTQQRPQWVGIIGQFYPQHEDVLHKLHSLGIPSVNVSGWKPPATTFWIHNDDELCGEIAANFFLDRGYRNFAFMGVPNSAFSDHRLAGFTRGLAERSVAPPLVLTPGKSFRGSGLSSTAEKIHQMPKPCAIFACNDQRARHCLEAAESVGVHIPDALAIIGVDDDDLFCEISSIPLSSVKPDWHRIGEGAVEHLLMAAINPCNGLEKRVPPLEVIARRSSEATAIEDPLAAAAVQYIHDNIDGALDSFQLARAMGISRRTLERHLLKTIGQSSRTAIHSARMQRAYQRVVTTQLSFGEIAELSGFSKQSQFNAVFKKLFKKTPGQARRG